MFDYDKIGRQVSAISAEASINSDMCRPGIGATHVITEIQYGFKAHLVFDKKVKTDESRMDAGGKLKITIEKLGPLSVEGEGELNIETLSKDETQELKFTFHGDTTIDPPPQTFQDAMDVYRMLPAKVGIIL